MADNKTVGRPPKYKTVAEMQEKIDAYFKECEGKLLEDKEGNIVFDKFGKPVIVGAKPITVTGLALALGFTSRQALLNYQAKKQFVDTITRAKSRIEQYAEERLFDRDGANGAKFSLANNFKGWNEKQSVEIKNPKQQAEKTKLDNIIEQVMGDDEQSETVT